LGLIRSVRSGATSYEDENISVKQLSVGRWQIADKHYQDEEGGAKPGYKKVIYEASIEGDVLTIKEGKYTSRFNRCNVAPLVSRLNTSTAAVKGECKVELAGVDLHCNGSAMYIALNNGHNIITFPTEEIAVISCAGTKISERPGATRVLWVYRAYINQNMQEADGQCSLESTNKRPVKLECRALLRDGRKLNASVEIVNGDDNFFRPLKSAGVVPNKQECRRIVETHGFLTRAQFQCGFRRYNKKMLAAAKTCSNYFNASELRHLIVSGMKTFDRNERGKGRRTLCAEVLKSFPKVVGP
jgi:hypothetical protein